MTETPIAPQTETVSELLAAVLALDTEIQPREKSDRTAVSVPAEKLLGIMQKLRASPAFAFDMLCAHTVVDWLALQKIELIYQLYSTASRQYLQVSVWMDRSLESQTQSVPSVSAIWAIAEFQEREVFEMFGVRYSAHPDLRRLLLEDEWKGFPLRKDYKDDYMLERPWG